MWKQSRGVEFRQALSRLMVSLFSSQHFPTVGFCREAKGSARTHPRVWDGNLLSCLSVLLGGAQIPHCTEIFAIYTQIWAMSTWDLPR